MRSFFTARPRQERRQPRYAQLGIDMLLEERVTPTNFSATITGTVLTLTKTAAGDDSLTIVNAGSFQKFTINTTAGNTINGSFTTVTTPVPITAIVVNLGSGDDSLTFDGSADGNLYLPGGLTINGSGGNKTINAQNLYLLNKSALKITLNGSGTATTTFTDSNVAGAATISHTGSGNTSFTLNTTSNNATGINNWGSLTITNGAGADNNLIQDTLFAGSINITNGSGSPGDTSQFAGSKNLFAANNSTGLLTVRGGLSVATTSGQSDTEINDYNVNGTATITTGSGINGQTVGNFVGIANDLSISSVIPTFGGIKITGTAVPNLNPGLLVDIGTNASGDDFPILVKGALSVTTNGSGAADIGLNDLFVTGAATVSLGSLTSNNVVNVQGDAVLTTYGSLAINSSAIGNNTFNIQTVEGSARFNGALSFKFGPGNDTVNIGAATGDVFTGGALAASGNSGNKTLNAVNSNLGSIAVSFTGAGSLNSSFTDVNVFGAASLSHTGAGGTTFSIATSSNNANALNTWGSLAITNGAGADNNTIFDTNFSGGVAIANGPGAPGNTSQFGGSHTVFDVDNYTGLLNVQAGLSVTTGSGHSDTQINDYNVRGVVTVGAGAGISGQGLGSFIGINNNQSIADVIPTIGGASLSGGAVANLNPGLLIDVGTNTSGEDFPLNIHGPLTISTSGAGAADIELNDLNVSGASTINLGGNTRNNVVNVHGDAAATTFGALTVNSAAIGNNTFNVQTIEGNAKFNGGLNFKLGTGADVVNVGSADGPVVATGTFGVSSFNPLAASGSKTINALNDSFGSIAVSFPGSGTLTSTFTDVNVAGAATLSHTGSGATNFTLATSSNNANALNSWGSLAITNGAGADINTINDTDFSGSVSIANGAGASGNTGQYGGSHTVISADNYQGLLTIQGNLSITTGSGQSDSEVFDYNVNGNVTINTGIGIANQTLANHVALEDNQTVAGSGIPVIGGNVAITATAVKAVSPGAIVNLGIDDSGNDFPLIIYGNLNVTANGGGAAQITLNDLDVGSGPPGSTSATTFGTTTISLGSATSNNVVNIQGSSVTSAYWNLTINSFALGANTYNLQAQDGALQIGGNLKMALGSGSDTINLATTSNAILELFGASTFNGGLGVDALNNGAVGANLFFITVPIVLNIP
jgi:hypothetical protein